MLESLTDAQRNLLALLAGVLPGILGLALPGGLVRESVSLDFADIFIATVPWTASVAAIGWLALASEFEGWPMLGSVVGILLVGALVAPIFGPEYKVAEDQATQAQYYWVSQNPDAIAHSAGPVGHNPKVALAAALVGIVIFIAGVYGILYGGALWFAGIVCGAYLGWQLHLAFTAKRPLSVTPRDGRNPEGEP
jgi:hypothetical protein